MDLVEAVLTLEDMYKRDANIVLRNGVQHGPQPCGRPEWQRTPRKRKLDCVEVIDDDGVTVCASQPKSAKKTPKKTGSRKKDQATSTETDALRKETTELRSVVQQLLTKINGNS